MPKRPKHVLLLMPREIHILSRFMDACRRMGVDVTIAFDQPRQACWQLVTLMNGEYGVTTTVAVPPGSSPWTERLPEIPADFDAIVPTSEFSVQLAEHLGRRHDLFHNPIGPVDSYRDKYEMRRRFAQAGISQPSVLARFGSLSEVDKHPWEQVRFPVIAKPVDLTSSLYVRCVDNPQEARSVYRRIFKHVQSFGGASFSGAGLLEEYVPGPEYSAECIVDEGLLVALFVTTKFVSPLPACDEIGHLCGAPVPARHRLAIEDTARRVIAAWQIKGGVLHIEYKYLQEKVIVMEAACRIGGDFISELVELQHGVNLEEHLLRIRSNSPCPLAEAPSARDEERFGIRFMFARSRDWHPENGISVLREIRYSREAPPHREFGIHERIGYQIVRSRDIAALKRYLGKDCSTNVHLDCSDCSTTEA